MLFLVVVVTTIAVPVIAIVGMDIPPALFEYVNSVFD